MDNFYLTFSEGKLIIVGFNESFTSIMEKTADLGAIIDECEPDELTSYIVLPNEGIEFSFHDDDLRTIFFHINEPGYKSFKGSFWFLEEDFWNNPTKVSFQDLAGKQGFDKRTEGQTHSLSMIKDAVQFHYESLYSRERIVFERIESNFFSLTRHAPQNKFRLMGWDQFERCTYLVGDVKTLEKAIDLMRLNIAKPNTNPTSFSDAYTIYDDQGRTLYTGHHDVGIIKKS